jgi:hypothetical protein
MHVSYYHYPSRSFASRAGAFSSPLAVPTHTHTIPSFIYITTIVFLFNLSRSFAHLRCVGRALPWGPPCPGLMGPRWASQPALPSVSALSPPRPVDAPHSGSIFYRPACSTYRDLGEGRVLSGSLPRNRPPGPLLGPPPQPALVSASAARFLALSMQPHFGSIYHRPASYHLSRLGRGV